MERFATGSTLLVICFFLFLASNFSGLITPSLSLRPLSTTIQLHVDQNKSACLSKYSILPNKRVVVAKFISIEKIEEFLDSWPNHEDRLLQKTHNSSVLLTCPSTDAESIKRGVLDRLQWSLIEQYDHEHAFANGPLLHYKTLSGVDILLQPMNLHLPRPYLQNPTAPTCTRNSKNEPKTWSLSYALYSGAVFSYHIIQLPVLSKFDYFLKVDTDINFIKDMPFDIGEEMDKEGCLIGHSQILTSSDCEDGALDAVLEATEVLQLEPPKSIGYGWCNEQLANFKPSLIFYGNFLAFSTHNLLLHPHIQSISRYMYEDYKDGYFGHRWGDQAPFVLYACDLLDIPDIHNDSRVCDMEFLRDDVFIHA